MPGQASSPEEPPSSASPIPDLPDDQLQALHRHPAAFLATPSGIELSAALARDAEVLADFARRQLSSTTADALRVFRQRLDSDAYLQKFAHELLVAARPHLAAVARSVSDERLPLEDRRAVVTELAIGVLNCGSRIDEEFRRAHRSLSLHDAGLRQAVARTTAQCQDALIEELCEAEADPVSMQQLGSVHWVVELRRRVLDTHARADPLLDAQEPLLRELTVRGRALLAHEVTPCRVARLLADECLAAAGERLRLRLGDPLDLAGRREHARVLEHVANDLARHYGRLNPRSFQSLDDEGMPRLATDAALIALDIRASMAGLKLAPPALERELLVIGQQSQRLAVRVNDDRLWYVVIGDAALNERSALLPEHVREIAAAGLIPRLLEQAIPEGLTAETRRAIAETIGACAESAPCRLGAGWINDPDICRAQGRRARTCGFADWADALPVDADAHACVDTKPLLALVASALELQPDPSSALKQLRFLRPWIAQRLERAPWAQDWLLAADAEHITSTILRLDLLRDAPVGTSPELLVRQLAPVTIRRELPWGISLGERRVMSRYFDVLATLAERGVLPSAHCASLFNPDSVLGLYVARFFHCEAAGALFDALGRLLRCRALSCDDIVTLLNYPVPPGGGPRRSPLLFKGLTMANASHVHLYIEWLMRASDHGLPAPLVRELLCPSVAIGNYESERKTLLRSDWTAPQQRRYLEALRRARDQGVFRDSPVPPWLARLL